ncbi:flagellar basal body L-ring protein FlgH [Limibaculum sp. M0105]|uniref:Flagellar L-ring protein n=1 Tax=Thermohalobaculum xanthum TaxID=2753746 RepID=A0A8J7M4A0_9RHOB|nr:flagellar basal body L-ring protein FlgH [Thermohalobaculum xanthum]MBK0398126.1 flagellar basal body L-ring protein FlgH [Thermohalobaculum xanthum]
MKAIHVICLTGVLAGCAGQLDSLGRPPTMTAPGAEVKMYAPQPAPERVALSTAPAVLEREPTVASLWQSGPNSLFGDRRARVRGDILTVVVEIDDEADLSNVTARARSGQDEVEVSALFGLPSVADVVLPGANTLQPAVSTSGTSNSSGSGSVARDEEITLRLAATVQDILPNGHMIIRGSQEVRVNFELRELQVSGIIRPEDISRRNEISYDKIADARIVYGGRGQLTDVQQPRIGQQLVDLVVPF